MICELIFYKYHKGVIVTEVYLSKRKEKGVVSQFTSNRCYKKIDLSDFGTKF